jgi:SpoU rRNA methylase family enzyme
MESATADVKHTARLAASFGARAIATRETLEQLATNGVTH